MYCVEVMTANDDYKRPTSSSQTFMTHDVNEAIGIAATEILRELSSGDFYRVENEDQEPFVSGNPQQVWEWYMDNEDLFTGEFVPSTFSVTIFRKESEVDSFDRSEWDSLCQEARNFFAVED